MVFHRDFLCKISAKQSIIIKVSLLFYGFMINLIIALTKWLIVWYNDFVYNFVKQFVLRVENES